MTGTAEIFRANSLRLLSERQQFSALTILSEIARVAEEEETLQFSERRKLKRDQSDQGDYEANITYRRPHQNYLIHGPRGSGKTFLLLSMLGWLRSPRAIHQEVTGKGVGSERTKTGPQDNLDRLLERTTVKSKGSLLRLLDEEAERPIVLKCIFPADSEAAGTVMDGIFAQIMREIGEAKKRYKGVQKKLEDLDKLEKSLRTEIAGSWAFDRNLGGEALLNDSVDFAEYAKNRADKSWDGVHRIEQWRTFVGDLLSVFSAEQLIIGIDDTDVRPRLTIDTLESLRLYLDHPRIVTIIAGNLSAMRKALVVESFAQLGQAISSVGQVSAAASYWRRTQRREVEQYLEKVLPTTQRFNIGSANERFNSRRLDADFAKFAEVSTFDKFCRERLNELRQDYFSAKAKARRQYLDLGHDLIMGDMDGTAYLGSVDYRALESYVAWWQLRHHYASALRPTEARQIKAFLHYFQGTSTGKRLIVFMFESAANAPLLHEMNDNDTHAIDWLRHQKVGSNWVGQRYISVNGREFGPGTYPFEVLCYRIDVAMSMPLRFPLDSKIPRSLLPTAWGKDTRPAHRKIDDWRLSTYVVGAVISHGSIPRNCRFMSDLRVLPDVAFVSLTDSLFNERMSPDKIGNYVDGVRHLFDLDEATQTALDRIGRRELWTEDLKDVFRDDGHAWLNDLRRAWAATLIFDYGMHNEVEFSSKTHDAEIRASRPPSNRSLARYKLLTIDELEEITKETIAYVSLDPVVDDPKVKSYLRRARHLLLYLCAVSDALPALMLLGQPGQESQSTSAKGVYWYKWRSWLLKALSFVVEMAHSLDVVFRYAEGLEQFSAPPMAVTPDVSFITLMGTRYRGSSVKPNVPDVKGFFLDTLTNLDLAWEAVPETADPSLQESWYEARSDVLTENPYQATAISGAPDA